MKVLIVIAPFRILLVPLYQMVFRHRTVLNEQEQPNIQPFKSFSRSGQVSLYHQQGDVSRSGFPGATGQTTTEMIL